MSSSTQNSSWKAYEAEARFERAFGLAVDTQTYLPPAYEYSITNYPQQVPLSVPSSHNVDGGHEAAWKAEFDASNAYMFENGIDEYEEDGAGSICFPTKNKRISKDTIPVFAAPQERDGSTSMLGVVPPPYISTALPKRGSTRRLPRMIGQQFQPDKPSQPRVLSTVEKFLQTQATQYMPSATLAPPLLPMPASSVTFLQVHNGRKGSSHATGSPFADFQKNRPPYNVQPPLDVDIGMREICVFLPDWLHIVEVVVRLMRNGATRSVLAKMQLLATGELTQENFTRCKNKIQQQFGESGRHYYGTKNWNIHLARDDGVQDDMTASSWTTHRKGKDVQFEHIKLAHIYSPIPTRNFPTGRDRLLLTQCLEFAMYNPQLDLDTSHFDWIIRSQGLQAPPTPSDQNRDQEAIEAFSELDP